MVLSNTYVVPGNDLCPALPHDHFAHSNLLSVSALNPKILRIGIVEVFGRSASFRSCHEMIVAEARCEIKLSKSASERYSFAIYLKP